MAEEEKKPAAPEPTVTVEQWSTICPNDLGLKAGFYTAPDRKEIVFRDIIGWITYTIRDVRQVAPSNGFLAVVLSDFWFPALAANQPNYAGVFLKEATVEDALKKVADWRQKPQQEPQVNVKGVGKA